MSTPTTPEQSGAASGPATGSLSLPIVPGPITIDPSDPEVQWILSKTCLSCGPMAHVFQRAGYPIPRHAEEEQAHVLLWMLSRYKQNGADWREKADDELRALKKVNSGGEQQPSENQKAKA